MLLEFEDKNRRCQRNTVKEEKGNFVSKDLLKNCFVTEREINVMVGQVRNEISKDLKVQAYFCNNFLLIRASFSCFLGFQSSPSRAQSLYSSQRALTPLTAPLQSHWSQRAF